MSVRIKAVVGLMIFLSLLTAGWMGNEHLVKKRLLNRGYEDDDGVRIHSTYSAERPTFRAREYVRIVER